MRLHADGAPPIQESLTMEVLHECCAGLDVHKKLVVACVRTTRGADVRVEVEEFGTTTSQLLKLADWLASHQVKAVAMEATGVYWRPVWHILSDQFDLTLANPATIKAPPGRKTDVKDAQWIAQLHACGLIERSFVPPPVIQEARDLTRTRKQLGREIVDHTLRITKVLEDANIKLSSVLTDVLGVSGRNILKAIIAGESDPTELAKLAVRRAAKKRAELAEALHGHIKQHHRFLLRQHLVLIEALEASIQAIETRLTEVLRPFRHQIELLTTIPGVGQLAAEVILAEIGADMSMFPTVSHLRSWACVCPRNDASAGKQKSRAIRKGSNWLKTTLVQCAWGAFRKKDCYLRAQFLRVRSRRGGKKAAIAVASSILSAAYYILRDNVPYQELGGDYFDRLNKEAAAQRHLKRLAELGYTVRVDAVA